ncbi:hypothetical protein [Haematobacter sp.]|uniref:hypothetical protein n=1 Tax=Haematobacter sp. TaxID=2953762 RepID=UPI0028A9A5FF|nr:hypothetical protein [Haematobacter sp.]
MALPISVSDILKILDQIPIWKTVRDLPARVAALEQRVAALEGRPTKAEHLTICATCGAPAKVIAVKNHPKFAFAGIKMRTVECEAGHRQEFMWDPSKD